MQTNDYYLTAPDADKEVYKIPYIDLPQHPLEYPLEVRMCEA